MAHARALESAAHVPERELAAHVPERELAADALPLGSCRISWISVPGRAADARVRSPQVDPEIWLAPVAQPLISCEAVEPRAPEHSRPVECGQVEALLLPRVPRVALVRERT